MRFLFYVPASPSARGGISVIMEMIYILNANGFEAVALYDRPDFEYDLHVVKAPRVWSASVRKSKATGGVQAMMNTARNLTRSRRSHRVRNAAPCPEWDIRPDDVVIVPEYTGSWLPDRLPEGVRIILCVQGYHPLIHAFSHAGFDATRFAGALATSEASREACRMVLRSEPAMVPLYISPDLYAYEPDKAFQVAYMPRKRAVESATLIKAVHATPGLEDVPFVAIDGASTDEAARLLRRSLFFLSFSEREGFGLPPAEAMATGALVIGYRGIGGNEFFTEDTGFPVPEDNLMTFYETLIAILSRYREDASALDALRRKASETILGTYRHARFKDATIAAFSGFQTL